MGTGIAIDQTGIRIIQARNNNGTVSINGAGYFPFSEPFEDWQSGFIEYQKTYSFPSGSAYVGVSGKHLSLRHVSLPARNEDELQDLVAKEVQQFAGSQQQGELSHAYQDVTPPGSEPDEVTVLLAILRKQWILQAEKLLKEHDLEVEGCVPDAISTFEAFQHSSESDPSSDQITMLAWVGYNSIDVCLVKNGSVFAARNTSGGISTILDEVQSSSDRRNLYKQFIGRGDSTVIPAESLDEDVDELIARSTSGLSLRISTAYDYFQENFPSLPDRPDQLYLSGQAARISGIETKLNSELDCPITRFDVADQFDFSELPEHKHQSFKAIGPEWTTALGLALANDRSTDPPLLFKTPSAKQKESWWNVEVPAMAGFTILLLAFLIYALQTYRINSNLDQIEQDLSTRVNDLQERKKIHSTQSKQANRLHNQLNHLRNLRLNGLSGLSVIQQLSRVKPDETVITSIEHPVNEVIGTVQVDGYVLKEVPNPLSTIKSFRKQIESNTSFNNAQRIPQETDAQGNKQFRFKLEIRK